jgi:hypothetical protein
MLPIGSIIFSSQPKAIVFFVDPFGEPYILWVEKLSKEFLALMHSFCVFVVQQKETMTQNQVTTKLMNRIVEGLGATSSAPSGGFAKATINVKLPNSFVKKETKTKRVQPWLHQIKIYMET